jgi:hypothetical protein
MNITINFDNFNDGLEEGVRIYRATAPIANNALPAPLATLPAGTKQYIDTTAVRGTLYYYRFAAFKGTDELISPNKCVKAIAPEDTGPGPKILKMGDWDLGYFGYCTSTEFMTYGSLCGALGIATGTEVADVGWLKVAYKGKVLFIARSGIRHSVNYNELYQAGAVFGTNDNGAVVPTGATATNQYRPVNVGDFTFTPRLLKGAAAGSVLPANRFLKLPVKPASCEYDDIMGMFAVGGMFTNDPNAAMFGRMDEVLFPAMTAGSYRIDMTMSLAGWDARYVVCRGNGLSMVVDMGSVTVRNVADLLPGYADYPDSGRKSTMYHVWRPVLEMAM